SSQETPLDQTSVVGSSKTTSSGQAGSTTTSSGQSGSTTPYQGEKLPFIGHYLKDLGDLGITFPVLKLSNVANLFFGQDGDRAVVNLKPIDQRLFGFGHTWAIPIWEAPPVSVDVTAGGDMSFLVYIGGGLDTSGLHNGSGLLGGLFLLDHDP